MDGTEKDGRAPDGRKQFAVAFGVAFAIAFLWIIGFPWLLRGLKALAHAVGRQP
ncbi:MAG: hypothetical protein JWM27_965 [Gemmatimonadetes bacterium]|nr:hypothetical protein [Gemmatimonadota bacterium]